MKTTLGKLLDIDSEVVVVLETDNSFFIES